MFATVVTIPGPQVVIDGNVAAIITALALLITSITSLIVAMRARSENKEAVGQVHGLVNSYATYQANRIEQLGGVLNEAGLQVPPAAPPPTLPVPETTMGFLGGRKKIKNGNSKPS